MSRLNPPSAETGQTPAMQGKTVVISGATSGIGEVAALALARQGARVVLIARDRERAERTRQRLQSAAPGTTHPVHYADLAQLTEMKRVAAEIAAAEPRIDVLINNAGALFGRRELTADGLERTFATNHLAYFVVTRLLLERLRATPAARIVSTASDAHRGARLDFADLQSERRYRSLAVYGRSKLMNILFTRELARRLAGSGVTANCLHPGFVATRFGEAGSGALTRWGLRFAKRFALDPQQGSETLIFLATSPSVPEVTGEYFHRCRPVTPTPAARSDADARQLWEISSQLAGLAD